MTLAEFDAFMRQSYPDKELDNNVLLQFDLDDMRIAYRRIAQVFVWGRLSQMERQPDKGTNWLDTSNLPPAKVD